MTESVRDVIVRIIVDQIRRSIPRAAIFSHPFSEGRQRIAKLSARTESPVYKKKIVVSAVLIIW